MLEWFWFGLTMACVVWYSTITVLVTILGFRDVVTMLKRLEAENIRDAAAGSPADNTSLSN